jgi:chromosome segregation ATPase
MTQEQLDALLGKFGEISTKIEAVENKFSDLESKVEKFNVAAPAEEQAPAEETAAPSVTAEQFDELNNTLGGLAEKFGAIETKFNALSQETGGQEPDPAGNGDSVSLV